MERGPCEFGPTSLGAGIDIQGEKRADAGLMLLDVQGSESRVPEGDTDVVADRLASMGPCLSRREKVSRSRRFITPIDDLSDCDINPTG